MIQFVFVQNTNFHLVNAIGYVARHTTLDNFSLVFVVVYELLVIRLTNYCGRWNQCRRSRTHDCFCQFIDRLTPIRRVTKSRYDNIDTRSFKKHGMSSTRAC